MNPQALERSAQNLLSSVITGGGWLDPLETLMSTMDVLGGGIARVAPPAMFAIPSGGVREQFIDFQKGRTPPLLEKTVLRPAPQGGFVAEHTAAERQVRDLDPFCQEFLRPKGLAHQVSAFLDETPHGPVTLLAFRPEKRGVFEDDDLTAFAVVLPYLRSAAIVSRGLLDGHARRKAEPFDRRGEPVLYVAADGRVVEANPAAERADGRLFRLQNRRFVSVVRADQGRFNVAMTAALTADKPGLFSLTTMDGGTTLALILPVQGIAHDVFRATAALVVLVDRHRGDMPATGALSLLREAAGLTFREAEVTGLVAAGLGPREAGERLGIGFGTARLHLKSAYAKLAVHSQAELSSLVRRLS